LIKGIQDYLEGDLSCKGKSIERHCEVIHHVVDMFSQDC
jgi:hypothetical protein